MNIKVAVIFGTRPEAIKLAPVIKSFSSVQRVRCTTIVTAQHRSMLDQVLRFFEIRPDVDLDLMAPDQSLASFTARAVEGIDKVLQELRPSIVLVQGDTTTTLCAALVSFYNRIPVGHVEAGLRTGDLSRPWPEEANRLLTSRLATLHFAPTETARANLIREGISPLSVLVTGNTVIDALRFAVDKTRTEKTRIPGLEIDLETDEGLKPIVLVTGHRRESFGEGLESICRAIRDLAIAFPQARFVYPVHLNPHVREAVDKILRPEEVKNIHLTDPLAYGPFIRLLASATLVITDSGGVQEEAPGLGKPVLVTRSTTERPEGLEAGNAILVGTDYEQIVKTVSMLLRSPQEREKMAGSYNPYGDGKASERILNRCLEFFRE